MNQDKKQKEKWVKLDEAYHHIGRAFNGVNWIEDTIWLAGGSANYSLPFTIFRPDYEHQHVLPDQVEQQIQAVKDNDPECHIVDQDMCEAHDVVIDRLCSALWTGDISNRAIGKDGRQIELAHHIWKDQSGEWEIDVSASTVGHVNGDYIDQCYNITVLITELESELKEIKEAQESQRKIEIAKSRQKPRGAGAKEYINWKVIDPLLISILQNDKPKSGPIAGGLLVKELKAIGWGETESHKRNGTSIPGDGTILKRITMLKKSL